MKKLSAIFIAFFCLLAIAAMAQQTAKKATLFDQYPASINCSEEQLSQLFTAGQGKQVHLLLPGNLKLEGKITHDIKKDGNLHMIAVSLPAFNNILFSISRRMDSHNKPVYRGHIINAAYADGYELQRNTNNNYQFTKVETAKLLPYCGSK